MPEEAIPREAKPSSSAVVENPRLSQDLASRIDSEFERYRQMQKAVRRESGKRRRVFIVEHLT